MRNVENPHPRLPRFRVRWRDPDGKRRSRTFTTRLDAEQFADHMPRGRVEHPRRRPRQQTAPAAPASDFLKGLMNPWQM